MHEKMGLIVQALDEVPAFAAVLAQGNEVSYANRTARRVARVDPIGRPFTEPWPSLERGKVAVERAARGSRVHFRAEAGVSRVPFLLLACPAVDGESVLLTGRCAPQLARARMARERIEEALTAAAHELRGPLSAARLLTESALARLRTGGAPLPLLDKILACLDHGARLTDLLLRAAGEDDEMAVEVVDLGAVVRTAIDLFRPLCAEHPLEVELPDDPLWVLGDRTRLTEVLVNLLTNAARHTPPGTGVFVRVRSESDAAILLVEDDGPGIDAVDLSQVFERFHRGRGARHSGGLGLGLYLSAKITNALGGTISAENRESGGARFTVRLPLIEPMLPRLETPQYGAHP